MILVRDLAPRIRDTERVVLEVIPLEESHRDMRKKKRNTILSQTFPPRKLALISKIISSMSTSGGGTRTMRS